MRWIEKLNGAMEAAELKAAIELAESIYGAEMTGLRRRRRRRRRRQRRRRQLRRRLHRPPTTRMEEEEEEDDGDDDEEIDLSKALRKPRAGPGETRGWQQELQAARGDRHGGALEERQRREAEEGAGVRLRVRSSDARAARQPPLPDHSQGDGRPGDGRPRPHVRACGNRKVATSHQGKDTDPLTPLTESCRTRSSRRTIW